MSKELFNPCYTLPLVLSAELVVALRKYAKQHDTPLHIVVVDAIKQYINRKDCCVTDNQPVIQ